MLFLYHTTVYVRLLNFDTFMCTILIFIPFSNGVVEGICGLSDMYEGTYVGTGYVCLPFVIAIWLIFVT